MENFDKELFELVDEGTKNADRLTSLKSSFKLKHKIQLAIYDNLGRLFKLVYKSSSQINLGQATILKSWLNIENRRLELEKEMASYLEGIIDSQNK